MKKVFLLLAPVFILLSQMVAAQCVLNTTPTNATISCGQSIDLSTFALGSVPLLATDFDNGSAGPGWSVGGGNGFGTPCGMNPSGTPYYWASTAGNGTPELATVGFDVSCGGFITFDMVYSTQGGATPCEGPDLANEGVTFEYSTNGGVTWNTIQYWDPNGGNDPMLTAWNTYTIPIPVAANSPSTMFRWIQYNSSGTCCDNWGLDNIIIDPGLCNVGSYDWANLPGTNDPTMQTVTPLITTQYTVIYSDGVDICYDTIDITVTPLVASASTSMAAINCLDCADLDVVLVNSNAGSIVDDFDPDFDPLLWSNIQNGTAGVGCTSMTGNALHFDGTGTDRSAATVGIDATVCGFVNFCLFMGNSGSGGAPCENADAGEDVEFQYSTNGGATWVTIITYDESLWDGNNNWQCFSLPIPPPAQTLNTMFRWNQVSFSACNGCDNWSLDNVSIACAPPVYDYVWSPSAGLNNPLIQAPIACPVVPTTYIATITDPATGCSATDNTFIDVMCGCLFDVFTSVISQCEAGNSFTVSGNFSYFQNPGTGTIEVVVTNASGAYSQTFNLPFVDGNIYNYSISGIPSDGSALTVDVYFSDDLVCTSQLIGVSPVLPTLSNVIGGGVYCPADVVNDITVDVTGNGPWSVDFTIDGVPFNTVGATNTINLGNTPGVYVIVNVNDVGCTNIANGTQTITIQPNPTIISLTGGDSYCGGVPINDIMLDASGTGPWIVDFTFNGVPQTINSAVSPFSIGNMEGNYVLTTIFDANCNDIANGNQSIVITPAPVINAGVDFINCENNPITLSAAGAQTYVWDNNVVNNVPFIPNSTLTYTVIGTDMNGCSGTDAIIVTFEPLPVVALVADLLSGCEPMKVNFSNTTPGNIVDCQWEFGDGNSFNGCYNVLNTYENGGLYDVTLTTTSNNGCVNSIIYNDYIYVEDVPEAAFNPSLQTLITLNTSVSFANNSSGAVTYEWDFDDGTAISTEFSPNHDFPQDNSGAYAVTLFAYSPIGCVDSVTHVIQVTEEIIYYLPNTFTPDGDEFNQHFQPVFTAGYDPYDFSMLIFNRWGEVIWESKDASIGWDGTYKGKTVQDGQYSWEIEFKTSKNDERIMVTGHVNVIR